MFLARVADVYVRALDRGRPPVEAVVNRFGRSSGANAAGRARGWVHLARRSGFIVGASQPGWASGRLSRKAIQILEDR